MFRLAGSGLHSKNGSVNNLTKRVAIVDIIFKDWRMIGMSEMHYTLGTDQQQAWMQKNCFPPRGYGFAEPGTFGLDATEVAAYNVAKSFYQVYPEVWNIDYVCKKIGGDYEDVKKRLKRMYDEHLIMFVMNPNVAVYGWGLYYWVVKLKDGTPAEVKKEFANWYQNKDDICTGYLTEGDFDFFNGDHMRVIDNLLADVIQPWKDRPEVEYVHLCPIRADVRESLVNQWDVPADRYRKFVFGEEQLKKFLKAQKKLDKTDFAIIEALNNTESIADMFNFEVLEKLSGLDGEQMRKDIVMCVDERKFMLPMLYINYRALGLSLQMYLVRMFQNVPSYRKAEIVDEFSLMPEFVDIFQFGDSFYDCLLSVYAEINDVDAIREKLENYAEIEEVKVANSKRQFRRWVARLDDDNGYWEECVMTDDFLQNRMETGTPKCRFCTDPEEVK